MKLDKHVVDMFTELTKPADDVKMEKTCYGTISVVDGTRYVKLDGSDLLVPAASTVKTSHGDRVTVLMKNHSLTVTGNLTAPATDGEGGSSGEAGTAATIEVGTVTTGEAGSSASVTNSGTTSAAVFDFVIPRGDKGEKGDTGPQGPQGEKGDTGTWDGTIPDHEHTVSDITDFPTSLPANGGNADTIDRLHASDFYQAAVGLRTIASYSDIFSTELSESHACWNKWCFVVGSSNDSSSSYYIDNAPETTVALWYEVFTGGVGNRAFQIAIGCYTHQRKTFIRYMHDWVWSDWKNIADGGDADTLDGKDASDIISGYTSWENYTSIPNNSDLNSYTTNGLYISATASTSATLANNPSTGMGFYLEVYFRSATNISQKLMRWDGVEYRRYCLDGAWTDWQRLNDGGNADTLDGKHANEIASNPNYVDNPNFKVNQSGLTSSHGAGYNSYVIDRWYAWSSVVVDVIDNGIRVTYKGGSTNTWWVDHILSVSVPAPATVSFKIRKSRSDLQLRAAPFGYTGSTADWQTFTATITAGTITSIKFVTDKGLQTDDWFELEWVKLEMGSIATPFCPPDPDMELLKIQAKDKEFLYADGFAGQLAKLFSQPANDTELATVFSVAPDNATLDTLNPGIYVVNTSAARRSLNIPNEIIMGGPNGTTVNNSQCIGGILIKLGSILGKPGFYTTVSGQAVDRPYTTSCAFFISNNGSIYRAIESIHQGVDHTGAYMYARWTWKAFVFDLFSNTAAYTIQSIEYINTDVTLAPGKTYTMYTTMGQFALPYTSGTAYGPTKSFPLQSSSSNPNLCIVNDSSTENLIIPAGRYLIHAR